MSFKYDVSVESPARNQELLNKFKNDLQAVGWKSQDKERNRGRLYCNATTKTDDLQKEHFWECDDFHSRKQIFNIDNEWEYKAALAIASIVDDNESHVGEFWNYTGSGGNPWFIERKVGDTCTIRGYRETQSQDYKNIPRNGTHAWVKLTPEEIIAYFKPKGESVTKVEFCNVQEFVLPEKWYVTRNSSNAKELNEWGNKRYNRSAFRQDKAYFFSDKSYDDAEGSKKEYTEITFEQFKKYVMKEEGKKIKEYKLRKDSKGYEKAAAAISYEGASAGIMGQVGPSSVPYNRLSAAGVLDLWFEPVYEEENKRVVVTIGTPAKSATIMQDGKIIVDKIVFNMEDVRKLQIKLGRTDFTIGDKANDQYAVDVFSLWIGCRSEGTAITTRDVDEIISEYNKLQL